VGSGGKGSKGRCRRLVSHGDVLVSVAIATRMSLALENVSQYHSDYLL
jgi:hypothetical protein